MSLSNADMTLYRHTADGLERVYVPDVWWFEQNAFDQTKNGTQSTACNVTVRIWDTNIRVCAQDLVVKGNCEVEAHSIRDLAKVNYKTVMSVTDARFGGSPHIHIKAISGLKRGNTHN